MHAVAQLYLLIKLRIAPCHYCGGDEAGCQYTGYSLHAYCLPACFVLPIAAVFLKYAFDGQIFFTIVANTVFLALAP